MVLPATVPRKLTKAIVRQANVEIKAVDWREEMLVCNYCGWNSKAEELIEARKEN